MNSHKVTISQEDREYIRKNEHETISKLALQLNKNNTDKGHVEFILNQISGRQASKIKVKKWYNCDAIIYPPHLSMEQSSSEATALYKASLIENNKSLVDLTGGLGVDFFFLASKSLESVYVEQNELLCKIAEHNFNALGLSNYTVINKIGEEYLKSLSIDERIIYIDPSRRNNVGKKVFNIEDCSPNIIDIQNELVNKSSKTIIKFSPMLDISLALNEIQNINEVHVVSVDNDCKELLLILSKSETELKIHTANIKKDGSIESFSFKQNDELEARVKYSNTLNKYLYEPNTAILKAGAFKCIEERFNVLKLEPNSHLYTSDILIEDFPGRVFKVITYFAPNKKNIKEFVSQNKKANISARNYPMNVSEIRKTTKIKDGGDVYLFASTLNTGEKIWINCEKI